MSPEIEATPPLPRRRNRRAKPRWGRARWLRAMAGPQAMVALPVVAAGVWLTGYEAAAIVAALGLPALLLLSGLTPLGRPGPGSGTFDHVLTRTEAQDVIDDIMAHCRRNRTSTAALIVQVDGPGLSGHDWGDRTMDRALTACTRRIEAVMRDRDAVFRMGDQRIAIVLQPTRRVDLDLAIMIADRVQLTLTEPVSLDGELLNLGSRVGICTADASPQRSGVALLAAADCALGAALRQEDGAVRAFTPAMKQEVEVAKRLVLQVGPALEAGEIRPWFQAQVAAGTGALTGFEALARWYHPDLGILTPAQFLHAVEASGAGGALGEVMLRASLAALARWDAAGLHVPHVGVNLSLEELRDPRLADRIIWEVDRHDVPASRISVEILETVTLADAEDAIMQNVERLRAAGFRLDLDDFGTGAASISHIARFGVHRIKIDRSFIAGLEADSEKRRVVNAILSLAGQLNIETLAEGVETPAQAEALAGMGCDHLQGYHVARPMPFEDALAWARGRMTPPPERDLARLEPRGTA
ncbi:bifunctional diguanylate cyclase/phosphodiesterase [Jannaschia sp. LMIT008]|uniref:bifunctional diguanylate cyclase/phosphodiesterase n=1 Tax=Jannaschia maritima TaxID=3032585 RepID=UPI0028122BAB|nr:bifunctional diguanylate cyclase/phosphodiesterase [Jannaschia sp. LMIT008]